jgi:diamine N-acetyltransferase
MNATIRRAGASDISLLIELTDEIQAMHAKAHPDFFVYPQDQAALSRHFADVLASDANHILLLEVDGQVVGHLYAEIKRVPATPFSYSIAYLFIHQLGIRTSAQNRGLGQKLLVAASDLARDNGLKEIRLDYWSFNDQARRFYDKSGFRVFREFVSKDLTSE